MCHTLSLVLIKEIQFIYSRFLSHNSYLGFFTWDIIAK